MNIYDKFSQYGIILEKSKYSDLYEKLTDSIDIKSEELYTEVHHVVPYSISKSNSKINLVRISSRKHFLCHYLLCKMFKNKPIFYKMIHAFNMMSSKSYANNKRYMNSRLYELVRRNIPIVMSKIQSGRNNSQYGKIWIYHTMLDIKPTRIHKDKLDDYISQGWALGKKIKLIKIKQKRKPLSKAQRLKISTTHKNKQKSEETKMKMSLAKTGKNNPRYGIEVTQEIREKIKNSNLGKSLTQEHKKKISDKNRGKTHTEESKEKMRNSGRKTRKGIPLTGEHKKKISESNKKRKLVDETGFAPAT